MVQGAVKADAVSWKTVVEEEKLYSQGSKKDFDGRERGSSRSFIIAKCSEQSNFLLCPASQTYVFYPGKKGDVLARS